MWTNRTLFFSLSGGSCTGVSDSDMLHIVLRLVEGPIGWGLTRRIAALHPATASSLLHRRDTLFQQIRPIFTLGMACKRRCHRTRGPPRTSAPTTAPHGNPADTAHGRVALVATEGGAGPLRAGNGRVALVATEGGAGPLAPGTGGSRLSRPRAARVHCAPGMGGSRGSATLPHRCFHERGTVRVVRAAEPARTPPAVGPG